MKTDRKVYRQGFQLLLSFLVFHANCATNEDEDKNHESSSGCGYDYRDDIIT